MQANYMRKLLRIKMTFDRVDYIFFQFLKSFTFSKYGKTQSFGDKPAFIGILNTKYNFTHHFPLW